MARAKIHRRRTATEYRVAGAGAVEAFRLGDERHQTAWHTEPLLRDFHPQRVIEAVEVIEQPDGGEFDSPAKGVGSFGPLLLGALALPSVPYLGA